MKKYIYIIGYLVVAFTASNMLWVGAGSKPLPMHGLSYVHEFPDTQADIKNNLAQACTEHERAALVDHYTNRYGQEIFDIMCGDKPVKTVKFAYTNPNK